MSRRKKDKEESYPMPPPMPIALKNTVKRTVISATEQEQFIITTVKNAVDTGKLDVGGGVNDLELDTMETSTASINKGNFKEIGAIGESLTVSSEAIFTSFVKIGASDTQFDTTGQYQLQLFEDMLVNGDEVNFKVFKFTSKSNVIQIGLDNSASDRFIQGLTFSKQDNYSSQGSTIIDRVGLISLAYGNFLDDKTYAPITISRKRFEGARTSIRCVYLMNELLFGNKKLATDEFSLNEKNFIDDLNNITNAASIYYTNFECNNVMLHGGGIVGGIGRSLEFYNTKSSNVEERYLALDSEAELVSFDKSFRLNLTDFRLESVGSIGFTTNNFLNALISSGNVVFYRNVQVQNNSPIQILGDSLEIRDALNNIVIQINKKPDNNSDVRIEDLTFNFYTGTFLAQGRFADVQLQLDDYARIRGPYYNAGADVTVSNNKNNPTLELQNKENYAVITNLPSSKTYLQCMYLGANSNATFTFANVCTTSQKDFIFSGFCIISATSDSDSSHLHLRLDGSYNNKDTTTPTILTKTVIKRHILTLESIHFTESVEYNNTISPILTILLANSVNTQFNVSFKLEVIAI